MSIFDEVTILFTCSVIINTAKWKLYTCKRFEVNMQQYMNSVYRILKIVEIKGEQLL